MLVEPSAAFLTDFGSDARIGGIVVRGIFDSTYQDPFGIVAGARCVLLCPDNRLPEIAVGTSVVVESISYSIAEIRPDMPGWTQLVLKS